MAKGFKDEVGKFRPTEKQKISPSLQKFRAELDVKQLPDSEIKKGLDKQDEFQLQPEFVKRLKDEKQRRLDVETTEKKEIETAKSELKAETIFFDEGDIENVDYDFTKDGRIFYPKGFEKEILTEFGAKKLDQNEIQLLIEKQKSKGKFKRVGTDETEVNEFLQDQIESDTRIAETVLDHDFEFGSLTTDENEKDEKQYFIIRDRDKQGELNIYDVTDLKGESVGGTGEPLSQIEQFIFPRPSLLFKFQGEGFEYKYLDNEVSSGFGKGTDAQIEELQQNKLKGLNIILEEFLAKEGKKEKIF